MELLCHMENAKYDVIPSKIFQYYLTEILLCNQTSAVMTIFHSSRALLKTFWFRRDDKGFPKKLRKHGRNIS